VTRRLFALAVAVLVSACASMPRSIELSQQQIESALARRLPYESRVAELFVVKVSSPRLTLLPDSNRLRLDFTVEATDRIVRRAVQGDLAVSFGLRYEASDASLRTSNVRVERLDLQGVPEQWRAMLQGAGMLAGEQLVEGAVLHRFTPDQVARAGGWTPGDIRVTSRGVRVELAPPR
jgi:hypothetical protein